MKNNFTNQILLAFLLCIFATGVNAQLTLSIDYSAGISEEYDMLPAGFGGAFPSQCDSAPITGELKIGDDGTDPTTDACEALVNDLTGFIALIDRGACSFSQKCANAEAAGAIAIMVCNNNSDPIFAMGNTAGFINTVPAFMISQDDCAIIRAEIPTVNVTIEYTPPINNAVVFWGNNGEGEFDGGLNDWTTIHEAPCDTVELWEWVADGTTLGATATNMFGDATSQATTACNGAMVFNSDGFDQNGICGATQIGELISPVMDLSAIVPAGTAGVSVLFHQTTRQFQSTYIVSYTNDGTTWNDIVINDEFVVNSGTFNVSKRVFLPGADLTSTNFQFKFRYEANYYYWIIDDVQLIETEANNLQANTFYAIAPNLLTPASQTDSVRFLIDIENIGASAQTNSNVNMNIVNSAGVEAYNEDLSYGTIPANFLDENRIFPGHFLPDAVVETYTGTYTVSADGDDFDLSNNTQSFSFQITDSTFAKEEATNLFGANPVNEPTFNWTMATSYFVRNGEDPVDPNTKYECSSVLVGLENLADNVGGFVTIYLYEWEDVNNDGISQSGERDGSAGGKIVGNYTYEILAGTDDVLDLLVSLENFDGDAGDPIQLKANTNYVLSAGLTSAGTSKIELSSTNDNELNATGFLTDSLTNIPRYSAFWNVSEGDGGISNDLSPLNVAPRMRMHVSEFFEVNVNNPLDEANNVKVYPNPATEVVNMELDLVENLNNAVVRIVDLNARNVMEVVYENLSSQTLTYSVANLSAGTYFLKIQSDKGYITKKFTVVK
jgi:hypothetical protein